MGFLSVALTFLGYTLIYGAVANHGRFATAPWVGVLADAYGPGAGTDIPSDPGPGVPYVPGTRIRPGSSGAQAPPVGQTA